MWRGEAFTIFQVCVSSSSHKREESTALRIQDDNHILVKILLVARTGFTFNKKGNALERCWVSSGTPQGRSAAGGPRTRRGVVTLAVSTPHPSSLLLSAYLLPLSSSADHVLGFQGCGVSLLPSASMTASAPELLAPLPLSVSVRMEGKFQPPRRKCLIGSVW